MTGRIIKGIGGFYYIKVEDRIIECKARGKFRHNSMKPMVGDYVEISLDKDKGVIEKILDRNSELIRPTVSNVTQAYVVFAIKNPDINYDLLNRFLVLCENSNIHAIVCLNKIDLCTEEEKLEVKRKINDIGYEVLFINAKTGEGIETLFNRLENQTTVLCGPSGVGKSTLINMLTGKDHMETGKVSDKIGRGKHTTRHSELIEIKNGYLVDTPGFSTIDINFIDKDQLKYCFPEFNDYNGKCKFNGCNHYKEPGCAVKEAVEQGKINSNRYDFYIKTLEEIINRRKNKW
ncbi:ribosome small subunit-dependent GTPase A [Clostridium fallax]|uniref:Small ribosomal subunit biogenesis GTPase RsgA n=1 Tax=Clostridium fallax TaxID=1533 RepID=A0A1M4UUF0_9CLOT|nr:ribosome small subunit-dependent GTPase A [Clostridium fallax]SHE60308.1 ribosome biogenesis GTPase [Clostridium fallax]SQB07087.1 ribosome-associated GTPase [Clostridium fallax]